MRDRIRQIAMSDLIEYCLDKNFNKSGNPSLREKDKVIKEIKNLLLAA